VPKVPKVKGTKMTITCFGPVFIGLKMGFPILRGLSNQPRLMNFYKNLLWIPYYRISEVLANSLAQGNF